MSGPSTRSHRCSVRGMETTLVELSKLLKANKSVVIITGAGLSAASGIPTFRGGSGSIWSVTAATQGRRSVFLRDPLRWYNEFWLRHFPLSFTRMTPNVGHEAISLLAQTFPELRVITQNIDGLQQGTSIAWPDRTRLVEAHGRLGLFKCVADDERNCPYSWNREVQPSVFPPTVREVLEDDAQTAAAMGLACPLKEIPRCPHCGEPSPPMSLLFDEDYDSHSFYEFERIQAWLKGADAIVFVGTSFAVTLTSLVIQEAKRRHLPVFDFNLSVCLKASRALNVKTVIGPSEKTLPELARVAGVSLTAAANTKTETGSSAMPQRGALMANGAEDISPLGRRSREESPNSHADIVDESEFIAAKMQKSSVKSEGDAAAGPTTVGTTPRTDALGAWGKGANFLLDPVLTTPLRKDQVRIDLSDEFSRKTHPDREVETTIEVLWQEQLAKNPLLFNGSKFRLAGYSTESNRPAIAVDSVVDTTSSSDEDGVSMFPIPSQNQSSPQTKQLRLQLGLTDYRSFRGTNWSPSAPRLAADSARDFPWLEAAYLSQKLGVGAIVETTDGFLLSLRRSKGVGEGQGMMGCPGGHPEPESIGLTSEVLSNLSSKLPATRRRAGLQATVELFESAVQEVVDETNVPRSTLREPLLSGIVRQGNSFGAPTASFIIPCSLPKAEVEELYARGAKEAFESTEMHAISGAEILTEGGTSWFAARNLEATPSFQGSLELWKAHRLRGTI